MPTTLFLNPGITRFVLTRINVVMAVLKVFYCDILFMNFHMYYVTAYGLPIGVLSCSTCSTLAGSAGTLL
jgi:hypothetical protein